MATVFRKPGRRYFQVAWYDSAGKRHERSAGTTDRRLAERIASRIQDDVAKHVEGLADARTDALAAAARRPIGEHLQDFVAAKTASGITEKQASLLRYRIGRIIDLSNAQTIPNLTGSTVMEAIAAIRRTDGVKIPGKARTRASQKTAAYYLRDCKHFTRWLVKDGRAGGRERPGLRHDDQRHREPQETPRLDVG